MSTPNNYFNRDLSWLSFNYRVLQEARDESLPLYERIKFLAIYSSNLDEFFRVRVASIRSLFGLEKKARKKLGVNAKSLLQQIHDTVDQQQEEFGQIFREYIQPGLEANQVKLLQEAPTDETQLAFIRDYFLHEVLPYVNPNLLRKGKIAHFLRDQSLYLAVRLYIKQSGENQVENAKRNTRYAIVQIPTHYGPRFVQLPQAGETHEVMFLDDIIRAHLADIFPGYDVVDSYSIKLSRDADLQIEDEFSGDLVQKISKSLINRRVGVPSRFLYDNNMPKGMLKYVRQSFSLSKDDLMPGGRYHNFSDFFGFPNPLSPQLENPSFSQLPHLELDTNPSLFTTISAKDRILHFPYMTYDYVLRFLNEAALDPDVEEINTTQYRVASNSGIVSALVRAALNGKKVTVFVEIKARFDEAVNLRSAQEMEAAGVRVIYSLPGLKVHAKVALVKRREAGKLRGYAFLSTGNFNEKTARIYADHGLMTANQEITAELEEVFAFLMDHTYQPKPFQHLLVAQFNMKPDFLAMIDREIALQQAGKGGKITIKLNNLEERVMIDKLYEASQAGVHIQMVVRGICCLKPGVPGLSENIHITRIVGQHLEHARVFIFHNEGANDLYLASADWMDRNLNRRVEVGFPILDPDNKAEIMEIIQLQLTDNIKAVHLNENMENIPVEAPEGAAPVWAQADAYDRIQAGTLGKH